MAQAVRALDCPWSDMTRLVLKVAPCHVHHPVLGETHDYRNYNL